VHDLAKSLKLKGTVLIAEEGINGMLSGSEEHVCSFEKKLLSDPNFKDISFKVSHSPSIPFKKLLVKVKAEILTLGLKDIQPHLERADYISPRELCETLNKNEAVTLIDVRNNFEVEHGTFTGALNPKTKSFSEFSKFVENLDLKKTEKIVTFCTGGIRCEKGALLLQKAGYTNVFQLHGGILEYFSQIKGGAHFRGDCFVFDERELVDVSLQPKKIQF